jgi:hypothetical protein
MERSLSGSIGNPLLESGSIVIGALVRDIFWDDIGIVTSQIDSGSHIDIRFWVYSYRWGQGMFHGTYLESLELIQFNTGSGEV